MKIAVTGGMGSVGRAVVDMALAQGHAVVCIDRVAPSSESNKSDLTYIQADITEYAALEHALRAAMH
jgi:UDP-glucose 4-epimerase